MNINFRICSTCGMRYPDFTNGGVNISLLNMCNQCRQPKPINKEDLIEDLLSLADSLEGCEWNHPLLSDKVCREAAEYIKNN